MFKYTLKSYWDFNITNFENLKSSQIKYFQALSSKSKKKIGMLLCLLKICIPSLGRCYFPMTNLTLEGSQILDPTYSLKFLQKSRNLGGKMIYVAVIYRREFSLYTRKNATKVNCRAVLKKKLPTHFVKTNFSD